MRRLAYAILLVLCCPAPPALANELRAAAATVYKIGVSLKNGRSAFGSAVLLGSGKLATSCHTTRDANKVVVLHPEGQLSASVEKTDLHRDVCILGVPALRGPAAQRLASSELSVGQRVTAMGYGANYRVHISEGEITALYRFQAAAVIRTSASFPRGASGGGLFDQHGRLIGILTFRASIDDELNYAVPVEWVDRLLESDPTPSSPSQPQLAFWDDEARDQPIFLRAAWLEYAHAWKELEALAVDWALRESDNSEAWLAFGRAKLGLGQHRQAVLALRRAVSLGPEDSRAWYWLASACHRIGFEQEYRAASLRLARLDEKLALRLRDAIAAPEE